MCLDGLSPVLRDVLHQQGTDRKHDERKGEREYGSSPDLNDEIPTLRFCYSAEELAGLSRQERGNVDRQTDYGSPEKAHRSHKLMHSPSGQNALSHATTMLGGRVML
jgi:hypothetical protein